MADRNWHQMFFKTITGGTVIVEYTWEMHAWNLKQLLYAKSPTVPVHPPEEGCVVLNGKVLPDDTLLSDHQRPITTTATLHYIQRGGNFAVKLENGPGGKPHLKPPPPALSASEMVAATAEITSALEVLENAAPSDSEADLVARLNPLFTEPVTYGRLSQAATFDRLRDFALEFALTARTSAGLRCAVACCATKPDWQEFRIVSILVDRLNLTESAPVDEAMFAASSFLNDLYRAPLGSAAGNLVDKALPDGVAQADVAARMTAISQPILAACQRALSAAAEMEGSERRREASRRAVYLLASLAHWGSMRKIADGAITACMTGLRSECVEAILVFLRATRVYKDLDEAGRVHITRAIGEAKLKKEDAALVKA